MDLASRCCLPLFRSNIPRLVRQGGVEALMAQYLPHLLTLLKVPTEAWGKQVRGALVVTMTDEAVAIWQG